MKNYNGIAIEFPQHFLHLYCSEHLFSIFTIRSTYSVPCQVSNSLVYSQKTGQPSDKLTMKIYNTPNADMASSIMPPDYALVSNMTLAV